MTVTCIFLLDLSPASLPVCGRLAASLSNPVRVIVENDAFEFKVLLLPSPEPANTDQLKIELKSVRA